MEGSEAPETTIANLANSISDSFDAKVVLYSGGINDKGFGSLVSAMETPDGEPVKENTVLILSTLGGFPNSAYRIARTIQSLSEKFIVCIPSRCKSAGTLIVLGAHKVAMGIGAEIGPLDVQMVQRDEIGETRSGMIAKTALRGMADETMSAFVYAVNQIKMASEYSISFDVSSKIASDIAAKVMTPVYAQIDPEILGNDLRNLKVVTAYGKRLSDVGGNVRPRTITKLVEDYPSHDFIIDRDETETLLKTVEELPEEVYSILSLLPENEINPSTKTPTVKRLDKVIGADPNEESEEHTESSEDITQESPSETEVDTEREEDRGAD